MTKIIPTQQILWYHGLASRRDAGEVWVSKTTVRFIKMSLVYLALGATLGGLFLVFPRLLGLKFAHVHFNLLGFMSMMVFGVAYHILPRFQGKPLYSDRMADVHFWLANIGLIGLVVFSAARAYGSALPLTIPLALSGIAAAVSVYLFVANMWLTFSQPIPER
jgi:heme/copper-type cytochrome/quinol oxidase subunit 1